MNASPLAAEPLPAAQPRTADERTLLVKVFGKDRPGITAGLFATLAGFGVDVIDIEQVVTRGRITLCALVTPPHAPGAEGGLRATVHRWAEEQKLQAEILSGIGDNRPRREGRSHVTVLGNPLTASAVSALTSRITAAGGNIDRVFRLAKYPVTAVELAVSGVATEELRAELAQEAAAQRVDVAVVAAGLERRAKRLIVMDVESTLIQDEVIELFAAHAGCEEQVAEVTAAAMRGELDFAESLRARVALLAGPEPLGPDQREERRRGGLRGDGDDLDLAARDLGAGGDQPAEGGRFGRADGVEGARPLVLEQPEHQPGEVARVDHLDGLFGACGQRDPAAARRPAHPVRQPAAFVVRTGHLAGAHDRRPVAVAGGDVLLAGDLEPAVRRLGQLLGIAQRRAQRG